MPAGDFFPAKGSRDNDVPFYIALPSPTIDREIESGEGALHRSHSQAPFVRIPGSEFSLFAMPRKRG
jgi:hypothetical protein